MIEKKAAEIEAAKAKEAVGAKSAAE
jgi:hypothetical protein